MPILVLMRHGQSLWNAQNQFTGWTDIDLSLQGREEARKAGHLLFQTGIVFHTAWTSILKRAIHTCKFYCKKLIKILFLSKNLGDSMKGIMASFKE